jgi:hypothetical protein
MTGMLETFEFFTSLRLMSFRSAALFSYDEYFADAAGTAFFAKQR